jgi:hypothetical protein
MTEDELIARYENWERARTELFEAESKTGVLDHDGIHANEDDAVELLGWAMSFLAPAMPDLSDDGGCPHERKVLVEGGYEREWSFVEHDDTFVAVSGGIQDFGDDGDGNYVLRCKTCLKEFDVPDEWEWD